MLTERYDVVPDIGGDAEAAGLAEGLFGHGRGQLFWLDILGTGFGPCLVDARGETVIAYRGEGGHHNADPRGKSRCKCGQKNCLEAKIGGAALELRYKKSLQELSVKAWLKVAKWLAICVRNQLCFIPTDEVIFSGGLICKQSWLLGVVMKHLEMDLRVIKPAKCRLSAFGKEAGLYGALALQHNNAVLR
jgi:predicted NBD/HSP70 family sugar kinase